MSAADDMRKLREMQREARERQAERDRQTRVAPQTAQIATASASASCPTCKGFVSLSGTGRIGDRVQLTGTCPTGHTVYHPHTIS